MKHVVMYSGGIASWATARTVIDTYDCGNVTLLFADVGGDHTNPHAAEDEDTYRFIAETAVAFGAQLVTLNSHETIWDVFARKQFLGNSRIAPCSLEIKQKPCRAWLETHCDPDDTIIYIGLMWDEVHRVQPIKDAYQPWITSFPLTEPPYHAKHELLDMCRTGGIEPPRLYAVGATHNNCGGGCVRAGQATFLKLLQWNPERFTYWETQEQKMRDQLGKNVAILKDAANDNAPLTLTELRQRANTNQLALFDAEYDIGGCGCFTLVEQ